ncbi:MAG TPA: STAS domain-containing protein [Solirubrobacteraceae bacterium]|nr:STAS domain-containing protein [Solirubrobacteraceae bacterium]
MVRFEGQAATLRCSGDEDLSTQALRRQALSQALTTERDVLVDLAALEFADSSFLLDLAMVARRLRHCDRTLHLRDAQPHVLALIVRVGLDRLPGVAIDGGAPALA